MTDTTASATTEIPAIERTLQLEAPPDKVWEAISSPKSLSRWFPDRAELDLRPGGAGSFYWKEYGTFAVRVEAVDEPVYLAWSWANQSDTPLESAPEVTLVEWRVEAGEQGGSVLTVRESGFTRPGHRSGNDEGWTSELAELVALLS
jgi:uncharacterized protein YndB with AHSA1/START domain